MTAVTDASAKSEPRSKKAPKVRAILAGGLVLGIGAAVTLAAWNDSEFAQGTFTAGGFDLQGSTNGTDFSSNPVSTAPKTLGFSAPVGNLSPGDTVQAPYAIRLSAASTYDTTVTVSTEASTGSLTGLTYTLTRSAAFGCNETITDVLVGNPVPEALGSTPGGVTFTLSQGPDTNDGSPVFLCFRVTADSTLPQSQIGATTWKFAAQS